MAYSAERDLYAFGVPRGGIPNPGRLAADPPANPATNAIEQDGHGFVADDLVSFRAEAGGSLPGGLSAGVTYYAKPVDQNYFQVAATAGGAAVDLTSAGSAVLVLAPLGIADAIAFADALIDNMLPAHVVPLAEPIPPIVRMTSAELAAVKLGCTAGAASASLSATADLARKRLEAWAKGQPLRGTGSEAQQPANLATASAAALTAPAVDALGWRRFGGTGGGCC